MSVSNCSACSPTAQTAPITGVVTDRNKQTGQAELTGVKGVAAARPEAPSAAASLSDAALSAVVSSAVTPLAPSPAAASAYSR